MSRFLGDRYTYQPLSTSFVALESDDELSFVAESNSITNLTLQSSNVHDDLVRKLARMPNLRSLNLSDTLITDKALDYLEDSQLEKLNLAATAVSLERVLSFQRAVKDRIRVTLSPALPPDEREALQELQQLNQYVFFTWYSPESEKRPGFSYRLMTLSYEEDVDWLRPLQQLNQLTHLELMGTYSAHACEVFGGLSTLEYLDAEKAHLDNVGWLSSLPKLETLRFDDSFVANQGWSCLSRMPQLRTLVLGSPSLDDEDFAHLPPGQPLTALEVWSSDITNASVPLISTFQNLKRLAVYSIEIDRAAQNRLHASLPKDVDFIVDGKAFDPAMSGD